MRLLLLLSVAFFLVCSSSYSQEYSYDGNLTQDDIDQSVLYGSPNDLTGVEEDKTYMDQIIDPGGYTATTGCLDVLQNRTWGGTQGGDCANTGSGSGDTGSGVFTFGYNTTVISQTQSAIAEALKVAGITVVGYRWQWRVKNADVNEYEAQNQTQADTLIVTITVKDKQGNVLDEREWDYSQYILDWEQKYGMHWYDPFITGDKIDTITLEVEGKDVGFWAGWYGPEFGDAGIYSIFVYDPDPCKQVPVVDPTCEDFIGNAPEEEIVPQELIIIESTGEPPPLEEQLEMIEEVEEPEILVVEETQKRQSVDPLSVAQAATASALENAQSVTDSTLSQQNNGMPDNSGNISAESIALQSQQSGMNLEIVVDSFEIASAETIAETALNSLLTLERNIVSEQRQQQEEREEEAQEEAQQEQEDLVAAALAGDDSEDAQAALLGYNPNFAQYQQPQMADADFYAPKEIYEGQKNYDNPAARFFNGASDATHREMVRQQYEGN